MNSCIGTKKKRAVIEEYKKKGRNWSCAHNLLAEASSLVAWTATILLCESATGLAIVLWASPSGYISGETVAFDKKIIRLPLLGKERNEIDSRLRVRSVRLKREGLKSCWRMRWVAMNKDYLMNFGNSWVNLDLNLIWFLKLF